MPMQMETMRIIHRCPRGVMGFFFSGSTTSCASVSAAL